MENRIAEGRWAGGMLTPKKNDFENPSGNRDSGGMAAEW